MFEFYEILNVRDQYQFLILHIFGVQNTNVSIALLLDIVIK